LNHPILSGDVSEGDVSENESRWTDQKETAAWLIDSLLVVLPLLA
jgi:hypothetical protein